MRKRNPARRNPIQTCEPNMYTHTHVHKFTKFTYIHTSIHTNTSANTSTNTNTYIQVHTYKYRYTNTTTNTNTNTHTYIHLCVSLLLQMASAKTLMPFRKFLPSRSSNCLTYSLAFRKNLLLHVLELPCERVIPKVVREVLLETLDSAGGQVTELRQGRFGIWG